MHIWYVKESKETRSSMLHQSGEPKGVIDFKAKKQAESKFRYELESDATKIKRADVYEAVGNYRSSIKNDTLSKLDETHRYTSDLQKIFEVLPKDLRGRWKVGNTDSLVTDDSSRMAPANRQMNQLIDKMLTHELKDDYQAFQVTAKKMDSMMTETHGQQHQGQLKWSEKQDNRLRKELANGVYRQFNENFKDAPNDQQRKSATGQPFKKDKHGNFEKIRHANGVDNDHQKDVKKSLVHQKPLAPIGRLNKIAKRMTKQSHQELQQMHRMMQDMDSSRTQNISDEPLSQHIQ